MSLFYVIKGKRLIFLAMDCLVITLSYLISTVIQCYYIEEKLPYFINLIYFLIYLSSFLVSFYLFQIYRIMWEYSNIEDMYRLIVSSISGFAIFIALFLCFYSDQPITIYIFPSFFVVFGAILYRIIAKDYFSRSKKMRAYNKLSTNTEINISGKRILICGAGEAGRMILDEYYCKGLGGSIIGFVDDDISKIGKILNGKMIFADTSQIDRIINKYNVNEIAIAMPSVNLDDIKRIVKDIKNNFPQTPIKTLPSFTKEFDRKPLISALSDIGIEFLLGREEFNVDSIAIEEVFCGKTILVTGAGGSIGSEISRQLLKFHINKLIVIDRAEFPIYNLINNLKDYIELLDYEPEIIFRVADVKDHKIMEHLFDEFSPDIIFHAAAHKHVPLMEDNEIEAFQNNVIGTKILLDLSVKYSVDKFVFISTDKAVNPVSIMGATKRIAELLMLHYNQEERLNTSIVRFGNVLGTHGSVIPLFCKQIENGGPVIVTHPQMKRFFMSITEASLLVINAAAYSNGGNIYLLDMGKQYEIVDIAKKLITLYGYEPLKDIKIKFSGLRPGEKLSEELYYQKEKIIKTENKKIYELNTDNKYCREIIKDLLENRIYDIIEFNSYQIRDLIKDIVPEFDESTEVS